MFLLLSIISILAFYFIIRACMLNNVPYLAMGFGFFSILLIILFYF